MQQNYSTTKGAGLGTNSGPGYPPNASWSNPNNITADDGSSASIGFFEGGQDGDTLIASDFGFDLPPYAVVDGISINVDGSNTGCFGNVSLSAGDSKSVGTLNTSYGDETDLWGETEILPATINDSAFGMSVSLADVSGGDGSASVDYVEITVFWHIDIDTAPADVPTRVAYKVYSRDGDYLGELPNVSSRFGFPQDINSAGSSIEITCGKKAENTTTVDPLLTDDDEEILTDNDEPILAAETEIVIAQGSSENKALFKNSNRVKVWMYNYWHPNGKLMFSGQVNKVAFKYGGGNSSIKLLVLSDGLDLSNYVARGYPFSYTNDVVQDTYNGVKKAFVNGGSKGAGWNVFGQTWITGASVTNIGAIRLSLRGTANVTVKVYDAPNGNELGSVTKAVNTGAFAFVDFEFGQLIDVSPSTSYFFAIWVDAGQSIDFYYNTTSAYANGAMYESSYAGGSGGGLFAATTQEIRFRTMSGLPTTTATYSSSDPTTGMMSGILTDYNNRGGYITERDFDATGLSLTYTFNLAFIADALKKVLELSPNGFYSYIDLGTAELDIKQVSDTADFTIVRGKDIVELDLALSIEQVKNYLLFTGGETGGDNLYRDYKDPQSSTWYGLRTDTKTDNRVTLTPTADAIGDSFIDENADEAQETTVFVPTTAMDITLLTPGKTIGFNNFDDFINAMILQIVRREFSTNGVLLTLGQMPIRMTDEVQRIHRELLNEQTINNPSAPS